MARGPVRRRSDRLRILILLVLVAIVSACSPAGESRMPTTPDGSASPSRVPSSVADRPPPSSGASAAAAPDGVYLAIGDSITFGIGVPRPQEHGYVARVAEVLRTDMAQPVEIGETRVFAVPGETATGFLDRRMDDVLRAIDRYGARVELVTIGLGANELLRARRDPSCQADRDAPACDVVVQDAILAAADALDRIVASVQAALRAAGSDARVLLLAYYNPDPDPLADATVAGPDATVACTTAEAGLDDRIACVADERGAGIVDLYAAFRGRALELTRFGSGDVHPNAAGYQVIADTILARLEAGR
jgi:lysophospholipase L1-like esterase